VRLVYLDEAGISATERTCVVAAVIVEPDRQYPDLQTRIDALITTAVPEQYRDGFSFHARDLISGSKRYPSAFSKAATTPETRWPVLNHLLLMPRAVQIPFVIGHYRKTLPSDDAHQDSIDAHAAAYAMCAMGVSYWMREQAPTEWALMIAEDRREARGAIERAHALMHDTPRRRALIGPEPDDVWNEIGSHVKDGVLFAGENGALPLQLADAIACVVRRQVDGSQNNQTFIEALMGGAFDAEAYKAPMSYHTYRVYKR